MTISTELKFMHQTFQIMILSGQVNNKGKTKNGKI